MHPSHPYFHWVVRGGGREVSLKQWGLGLIFPDPTLKSIAFCNFVKIHIKGFFDFSKQIFKRKNRKICIRMNVENVLVIEIVSVGGMNSFQHLQYNYIIVFCINFTSNTVSASYMSAEIKR
jgi:hypothetical protein